MNEKRFVRVFSILSYLSPHSCVTVHDLAAEYEVHERTIERDIEVLRDAQLGVFYDVDNTIKIHRNGYQKICSWMTAGKE